MVLKSNFFKKSTVKKWQKKMKMASAIADDSVLEISNVLKRNQNTPGNARNIHAVSKNYFYVFDTP